MQALVRTMWGHIPFWAVTRFYPKRVTHDLRSGLRLAPGKPTSAASAKERFVASDPERDTFDWS